MDALSDNPFAVQTPELLAPQDIERLFVDVFTDFHGILNLGHTFLHGPRGSGKSMMFRYMRPDCQLKQAGSSNNLPYFCVYVPVKQTGLSTCEWGLLEPKGGTPFLSEHLLVLTTASKAFGALAQIIDPNTDPLEIEHYYNEHLKPLLNFVSFAETELNLSNSTTALTSITSIRLIFDKMLRDLMRYSKLLQLNNDLVPYTGPLLDYLDFLQPLLDSFRTLSFFPTDAPIFVLIDDADYLTYSQTLVINGWVSTRSIGSVSIKVSTQLNYKTYATAFGSIIEPPHDFNEVNISTVYTSTKGTYKNRVREIITKRLELVNLDVTPEAFFPPNQKQEQAIQKIAERVRAEWAEKGVGYRAGDDAYRYARPIYMTELAGVSKSGSTYSYAGFEQLVTLSSGIIRYFLEAASAMYTRALAAAPDQPVTSISTAIQDAVVEEKANRFLFQDIDRLEDERQFGSIGTQKLRSLVMALGGAFRTILMSDRSERRVFSFAISDEPSGELVEILKLGVQKSYFHESFIGNKEGTGRKKLYILNRRMAPVFKLDPTSFAGYLFVPSKVLVESLTNHNAIINRVARMTTKIGRTQLPLFEIETEDSNDNA